MQLVWHRFMTVLDTACNRYEVQIHAFVLMSNHYHMLLSTPLSNLDDFMRYFQTETSRKISKKAERINHVFGTRYRPTLLKNATAFSYAFKYVFRNPVRAGLVKTVEAYRYSSLIFSRRELTIPVVERVDSLGEWIPRDWLERMAWLNRPTPKECEELIGKALRRRTFQFSKGNDVRKRLEGLKLVYGIPESPTTFSAEK